MVSVCLRPTDQCYKVDPLKGLAGTEPTLQHARAAFSAQALSQIYAPEDDIRRVENRTCDPKTDALMCLETNSRFESNRLGIPLNILGSTSKYQNLIIGPLLFARWACQLCTKSPESIGRLSESLISIRTTEADREGNDCADHLAKLGRKQNHNLVIVHRPPTSIHHLLLADMAHVAYARHPKHLTEIGGKKLSRGEGHELFYIPRNNGTGPSAPHHQINRGMCTPWSVSVCVQRINATRLTPSFGLAGIEPTLQHARAAFSVQALPQDICPGERYLLRGFEPATLGNLSPASWSSLDNFSFVIGANALILGSNPLNGYHPPGHIPCGKAWTLKAARACCSVGSFPAKPKEGVNLVALIRWTQTDTDHGVHIPRFTWWWGAEGPVPSSPGV
ncbi:hypothetical protein RND71_038001 [Anisodus tanguticus]|uniref:Uncharacterized protein n=1 Tax=Anisodus tanguticus TaxID=243964 RepID=A0AAE1QYV0_9SOLA|nr:hypothetical protein RND71_038001 [Anisodus tanguticus]